MNIAIISGASRGIGRAIAAEIDRENLDQLWFISRSYEDKGDFKTPVRHFSLDLSSPSFTDAIKSALTESGCKIKYLFKKSGRYVKQKAHSGGSCLEIPDVGNGSCKLDVTHTFAAHLFGGYLNAAFIADFIFITHSFVFSARAFPVLGRSKDSFTEQAVAFGTERTVVDGLRLGYLAIRPASDHFGRCQANLD